MTSPADPSWQPVAIWLISLASIVLMLIRPKRLPEALWTTVGASLLVLCRLITPSQAGHAAMKGLDVYLFLTGMMIVAELARREGVFAWVAVHAVNSAKGSRRRLFTLIYGVGIAVTVLLSNDATAVVLTPAVQAAVKAAQAEPLHRCIVRSSPTGTLLDCDLPIWSPQSSGASSILSSRPAHRAGDW